MKKKTLLTKTASIVLALLMVVSTLVVVPFSVSAAGNALTTIGTPEELVAFKASLTSDTYEGKIVKLTADIDMTDVTWTPAADTFKGTFDGNGYSIRNLSASTDGTGAGGVLFDTLENATVQNLCIVGGTITATVNNGGTLASGTLGSATKIQNVYINNTVNSSGDNCGAMIGRSAAERMEILNCVVDSVVTNTACTNKNFGYSGFIGRLGSGYIKMENCAFYGSVTSTKSTNVGVFVGQAKDGTIDSKADFVNCFNMGTTAFSWAETNKYDYWGVVNEGATPPVTVNSENFEATLEALGDAWTQTGKTEMMPATVAKMIGKNYFETDLFYQRATSLNADGTVDVRFITVIDSLDYDQVGFKIQISRTDANQVTTTSNEVTKATTQVFESITALGKTVTAEELGGKYIVAVVITGINCADYENVISVTAFVQNGETQTPTATGIVTLATTAVAA